METKEAISVIVSFAVFLLYFSLRQSKTKAPSKSFILNRLSGISADDNAALSMYEQYLFILASRKLDSALNEMLFQCFSDT